MKEENIDEILRGLYLKCDNFINQVVKERLDGKENKNQTLIRAESLINGLMQDIKYIIDNK